MKFFLFTVAAIAIWMLFFIVGASFELSGLDFDFLDTGVTNAVTISDIVSKPTFEIFTYILGNNLKSCLVNVLGAFSLGTITISNLVLNGLDLGLFLNAFLENYSLEEFVCTSYPHSFELIGFFISAAIGFEWSLIIFKAIFHNTKPQKKEYYMLSVKLIATFLIIALAAFTEAYISINQF